MPDVRPWRPIGGVSLAVTLACIAVIVVDVTAFVVAGGVPDLEVSVDGIVSESVLLGVPVVVVALLCWLVRSGRGRATGIALTILGVVTVPALTGLAHVAMAAPICDFGGGDACSYGLRGAPLLYAVSRTAAVLVAAAGVVAALVIAARPATLVWLARDRPRVRLPLSTRPFVIGLLAAAGSMLAISVINVPGIAERVDQLEVDAAVAGDGSRVADATRQAYETAVTLAGAGVVLTVAVLVLARWGWSEDPRYAGAVRVAGGWSGAAVLGWMTLALGYNPVGWKNPDGYHFVDGPIPPWYPPVLGALVLLGAASSLGCLIMLLLARLPRTGARG